MFYAACVFYGTAFMYNHDILCIFSPILEVEINIIIIIIINRTKFPNLNVSCLVLQLSLPNPLKPGIKLRTKM